MAEIIPFRGIFYNMDKVRAEDVVAPPYDIITPDMKDSLYEASPYNIVRIDFGKELKGDNSENKYTRAAEYLQKWLKEGILLRSKTPCFYAYRMDYEAEGRRKSLLGFFALVRLMEFGQGVFPHEATHSKPRQDRLSLLKICQANTSPIFALYDSEKRAVSEILRKETPKEPYMSARDLDGALHSLWIIEEPTAIESIKEELTDKAIFIADGHHRYETALEYKRQMRAHEEGLHNYVLMFLANISDGGITILPTHRLIEEKIDNIKDRLSKEFDIENLPEGSNIVSAIKGRQHVLGLYTKEGFSVLRYKGDHSEIPPALRGLDVVILDEIALKRLLGVKKPSYEMDPKRAEALVRDGLYEAAVFLNPTSIDDVKEVASASLRMPPKSTYFYPKLLTGFIINSLKNS